MMVTSWTNPWADAYNVFAVGEYRQVSLSELPYLMAEGEEDRDELIPRESPWPYLEKYMSLNKTTEKSCCVLVFAVQSQEEAGLNVQYLENKFKKIPE